MRTTPVSLCLCTLLSAGCALGPRALEKSHGMYNESVARVDSEELLLNIVRLRYGDPLAEVEVTAIAAQYELDAQAEARPFFSTESSGDVFRSFRTVLPGATVGGVSRPTLSLTPIHSGETAARYLRPITLDGVVLLGDTSWPISTAFRLWLEGLNGVPNAPSASGPTRSFAPEFGDFLRVTELLQSIQDRGELTFRSVEEEVPGDPIAADRVSGADLVEARKAGHEYRLTPDRKAWQLVRRGRKVYLDLSPRALQTPEYAEVTRLLRLVPGLTRYEIVQSTVGFIEHTPDAPPTERITFVPRSLIQVLYYVSHSVEVPAEHFATGVAKPTLEPDGRMFDWRQVTGGLFKVKATCQKRRPACASVAVRHRGYWFYIDDTDHATKSTLTLLRPSRRLDVGGGGSERRSGSPILTLPVGGR